MSQPQQKPSQPHSQLTLNGQLKAEIPDPEVVPGASRRQFTSEYKLRVLAEADRCQEPGQLGALLRGEGLYSSHLTRWRQAVAAGQLSVGGAAQRGRPPAAHATELAQVRQENQRLHQQLQQAELIMTVQKKLSQLLGLTLSETGRGDSA